jgi:spore coat protein U-like protein
MDKSWKSYLRNKTVKRYEMKVVKLMLIFSYLLISVSITSAVCTISTTAASFGMHDIFSTFPTDSTGSITITCDESPPPDVTVSIGPSPNSGGFYPRKMRLAGGNDLLNYNLYTNATYTNVWGDGTSGTVVLTRKAHRNRPETLIVYGRIPTGQDVSAGSYSDILTVTLNW